MIDLVALQSLRAVQSHGSVVAAAEVLGFTPSAVSQQIKKLERQTGAAVLERYGRGVLLTDHGERLAGHGADLLDRMEQIESDLSSAGSVVAGRLRVAAFSTAVRGLVAPMLSSVAADGHDLAMSLVELDPPQGMEAVASGQADTALVHQWGDTPLAHPDHIEVTPIGVDVADILVPVGHRLAERLSVTPADLVGEVFASAPVGSVCHEWLTRMFSGVGGPPRVSFWAAEWSSHIALVSHGAAVSLIPRLGREPLPASVRVLPVRDPVPTREVSLAWRRSMRTSPTIRYLRDVLVDLAPQLGLRT
ncbi:MAG TPA: LysR family transcriptional regulator [Lapillicoccus sp.]